MAQISSLPRPSRPHHLVLFDGVCGFCDAAIRWLLARDPRGELVFAPLQGETAAALRQRHPEIPKELESLVLVETEAGRERVYLRSEAAWRIFARLEGPWRWLAGVRFLPRGLRDFGYRQFTSRRYRWFGQLSECRLPDPAERARFLP
jgi:predicted DCC family thiol-disulfide oxidoreductase YuxK